MKLAVVDIDRINERVQRERREACESADGWDLARAGWDESGDYIVILCPKCEKRTAAWYDRSDGIPSSVTDNCDSCDEVFELKIEWETTVSIVHVEIA